MNRHHHVILSTILLILSAIPGAQAATNYVNINNATPSAPYTSWATAATNIQDAIDTASDGDVVLVSDGIYQTGGRVIYGALTNRVAVTKPLTLLSVNGPALTSIVGYPVPGSNAVRCVYLTNGALISGFTLTSGGTLTGDIVKERSGGGIWCESTSAVASNCVITGNTAVYRGGGVYSGTLNNCTITGNTAHVDGGGAAFGTLNNCTISSNSATAGGGTYSNVLNNCILVGNSLVGRSSTPYGAGAYFGTLNNCTISRNSGPAGYGGGAHSAVLNNCAVFGNSAYSGGGTYFGTLNNCTVVGNSASYSGGTAGGTANNCIVYYNSAPETPNASTTIMNYCCTTPLPTNGVNNITSHPLLATTSRLSAISPCRSAGSAAFTQGVDIDGEPWLNPPSIGCDEFYGRSFTGSLSAALSLSYSNISVGTALNLTGLISGDASGSTWDFGDGTVVTNQPYATHSWSTAGDYSVVFRVWNDTYPEGITATASVHVVADPVYYVSQNNSTPVAPYNSWATAATNIQDAVDAAMPGALVLVTNGVYQSGGRIVSGTALINRVAVDKPLTLLSVNGPAVTSIVGSRAPAPNYVSSNSVRCVYLTSGAILSGFTVTNGGSAEEKITTLEPDRYGGGIKCASINAIVTNCVLIGNASAVSGGGVFSGTLINCTLTQNRAHGGGGANRSTLINCLLATNSCSGTGGGAASSTLYNCTLRGNSAGSGGGANSSILNNCLVQGNTSIEAGGVFGSTLNNCAVIGNKVTATQDLGGTGGGGRSSTFNNCTVIGNIATPSKYGSIGGGGYACTFNNSIVYYNSASSNANYALGTLNYSCTTPLPSNGLGNISVPPQLASSFHLSPDSPCLGAGSPIYTQGVDIDGSPWLNPPSMGCDEHYSGTVTGALSVAQIPAATNITVNVTIKFSAQIEGSATGSSWDFGDGTVVSNQLVTTHVWTTPGDYLVTLKAWNDSNPAGVTSTVSVHVAPQITHYVSLTGTTPTAPYTSWATAATNIQHAIDASAAGDLILVSNGVYNVGSRGTVYTYMGNRVLVNKPLTLQSVNGPEVTSIQGYQAPVYTNLSSALRCVYLANDTLLSGFTLTNGATGDDENIYLGESGGGVWCESTSAVVSNCVLVGNAAYQFGAAAYGGTLINCKIYGNAAKRAGGATYGSTLINCTLRGNVGGGASDSTLYNCISYDNISLSFSLPSNFNSNSILNFCCTSPLPTNGIGNFTNAPLFVNQAIGDLRLQFNSPCINAGNNNYVTSSVDLNGNLRIVGGTVDIGAYEFQSPSLVPFYAWLQQHGLSTDGSADTSDSDGDGMNNWQEWLAGTSPTDASSSLQVLNPALNGSHVTITWTSVTNRTYYVERVNALGTATPFQLLQSNIPGLPGTTSYTDTNAPSGGPAFYRIGVQ